MNILVGYEQSELIVKNSRFIAELFPVKDQGEARAMIKSQKEKYADARHIVHAFILGSNAEILGMSDDGEPSGTAGRPVLDVLKGSGITNVLLTVTRYFGGILLGTGGLVKAYGGSAKGVLEKAFVEELVEKRSFCCSVSYSYYEPLKRMFNQFGVSLQKEEFESVVFIKGQVPLSQVDGFTKAVLDMSNGCVEITLS